MKLIKTLIILAALGAAGYWVYSTFFVRPETRACAKIDELCGKHLPEQQIKCEKAFAKLKDLGDGERVVKAAECVAKSETCAAAAGCVFGAGMGAVDDFLKGIKKVMGR
jgi:hypothetical protein